jgi:hypothetical protein
MAQVAEHLLRKNQALSSKSSIAKKIQNLQSLIFQSKKF